MNTQVIFDVMRAMPVFKPEMRAANREGRKLQTRRVIVPQVEDAYWDKKMKHASVWNPRKELISFCPYGKAGDYVYMREPMVRNGGYAWYKDDNQPVISVVTGERLKWRWKKDVLTSIFMPKEAARFVYQYTSIRVERVQEISRDDAKAEGVSNVWKNPPEKEEHYSRVMLNPYVANYSVLWDEINSERGYPWESNPWVWVLGYAPAIIINKFTVGKKLHGLNADLVILDDPMEDRSISDEARKAFENMVHQNFSSGINRDMKFMGPWKFDPDKKGGRNAS